MIKLGFTGTAKGMTEPQQKRLADILGWTNLELHHGDCVGADEQAHNIALERGLDIVVHPPNNPAKRAFSRGHAGVVRLPAKPYLERDRDIVDATEILVAAPHNYKELRRGSGTWYTVRYARSRGKPYRIIWPDGEVYAAGL